MDVLALLDEAEVDALLKGEGPAGGELAPVAELMRALRGAVRREPLPRLGLGLQTQLYGGREVPVPIRRATRRSLRVAAASVAVAAVLAVGAERAADNRLPTGLQDPVSATAALVGLDVPRSDERHDLAPGDATSPGSASGTAATAERWDDGTSHGAASDGVEVPDDAARSAPAAPPLAGRVTDPRGEGLDAPASEQVQGRTDGTTADDEADRGGPTTTHVAGGPDDGSDVRGPAQSDSTRPPEGSGGSRPR